MTDKKAVKPLGIAIMEPTVAERPKPQPKPTREQPNVTLADKMRRRGWDREV